MAQWTKSKYPGLRYRVHADRTTGVGRSKRPLRYYVLTYKWKGKTLSEALGWEGDYINTEEQAYRIVLELKQNRKDNTPPFTLRERREIKEQELQAEQAQQEKKRISGLSFSDVFTIYLTYSQANKRSDQSWKREEQLTRLHIVPVVKNLPLQKIAPFHLERMKKRMADGGSSPRTIRYALAVVRQVFNFAIREGLFMGQNPAAGSKVLRPKADNRKIRYLRRDEADLLLKELAKESTDIHDMSLLSLYTGMRFGEVASLRWADVDLFQGVLMVVDTKSAKNRAAFITPEVKTMLSRRGPGDPEELVFPPPKGDNSKPRPQIEKAYYKIVSLLFNQNLTDKRLRVNFHTLRHTFASWLVENGTDLYLVKELLGHSDLKITERYAHIGDNQLKQAVMRLQR
jgi:integrase